MQRSDLDKWKRLLESVYRRLRGNITEDELIGWHLVLRPWSYDQCREALIDYTRLSEYIPDPAEIAGRLANKHPIAEPEPETTFEVMDDKWLAHVKARLDYYHSHGAQTFSEFSRERTGTCEELYDLWQEDLALKGATDPPLLRRR